MKTLEKQLSTAIKSNDISNIHFVFDLIYNEYVKLVAFTIGKYVNDIDVIKDLTQDVFVSFFENIENVKSSIKYYLISSARNLSLDYLKKQNKIVLVDDVSLDMFNSLDSYKYYYELVTELNSVMSEKEVNIVILHKVDGYTFKEIGKIIGISHKNANKIYERALKKFKLYKEGGMHE